MKKLRRSFAIVLIFTLNISLSSCTKEEVAPAIIAPSLETSTPDAEQENNAIPDTQKGGEPQEEGEQITNATYFHQLNEILQAYADQSVVVEEAFVAFSSDMTSEEAKIAYCSSFKEAGTLLFSIIEAEPPENLAELHKIYGESCGKIGKSYVELAEIYETSDLSTLEVGQSIAEVQVKMMEAQEEMEIALENLNNAFLGGE